jgi:hypothetical protein
VVTIQIPYKVSIRVAANVPMQEQACGLWNCNGAMVVVFWSHAEETLSLIIRKGQSKRKESSEVGILV